jgi:hypothetical protein
MGLKEILQTKSNFLLVDAEGFGIEFLKKEIKNLTICDFGYEDVFLVVKGAMEVRYCDCIVSMGKL